MKKLINYFRSVKLQERIYAIFASLKAHAIKLHIFSVGGQFWKKTKLELQENNIRKFYMDNKEKIDKIKRLTVLVENLRTHIIGYSEFNELRQLLIDLDIIKDDEFNKLLKEFNYDDSDVLFTKINNYMTINEIDKMKTSKFIGTVSGGTISTQVKLIKELNKIKK